MKNFKETIKQILKERGSINITNPLTFTEKENIIEALILDFNKDGQYSPSDLYLIFTDIVNEISGIFMENSIIYIFNDIDYIEYEYNLYINIRFNEKLKEYSIC